jgi:hypothetical protein
LPGVAQALNFFVNPVDGYGACFCECRHACNRRGKLAKVAGPSCACVSGKRNVITFIFIKYNKNNVLCFFITPAARLAQVLHLFAQPTVVECNHDLASCQLRMALMPRDYRIFGPAIHDGGRAGAGNRIDIEVII